MTPTREPIDMERFLGQVYDLLGSVMPDMQEADDWDWLIAAEKVHNLGKMAREALHRCVDNARAEGASWGQVGTMLTVSKQAARQRFGVPRPPSPPADWPRLFDGDKER